MIWKSILAFSALSVSPLFSLSPTGDPWLLTPGPLTTTLSVKEAMLHDYGSRDKDFIRINREILNRLVELVNARETHVAIPLQGCGTFIVEATLRSLVPSQGHILLLVNGIYGKRMAKICDEIPRKYSILEFSEDCQVDVNLLAQTLELHPEITHVAVVHCETTTGLLNPLQEIASVVAKANRKLIIDAMSAFGGIPIDSRNIQFDALVASSNKCLQGVPGVGFCIARKTSVEMSQGNAKSLSLDLYEQWKDMEKNGQWRFTPPTHVLLALHRALEELEQEGGVAARYQRYTENLNVLLEGMHSMGFRTYIARDKQAPIIVTFNHLNDPNYDFQRFYNKLKEQGFVVYPGKLTHADTFRIGCIGDLHREQMEEAIQTIRKVLIELNINIQGA